ncbi:MAG: YqgE/AlgH family protein [Methylobacteriaceae bacterium]|nr:YqgE/AlgH family protein [Methylobacteriaceae bacterium]
MAPMMNATLGISRGPQFFGGCFLVAMPDMADERFRRAVVYLCSHSREGAMGIVINHPALEFRFVDLLKQLNLTPHRDTIRLPAAFESIHVFRGGPVETSRGFVLHSPDYYAERMTTPINSRVSLTSTVDILRAIATGEGPQDILFALGYAGWAAGQLEQEIRNNGWLICKADIDVLFHTAAHARYDQALRLSGIEPRNIAAFSHVAGHA